jgi:hypothetical protein
MHCSRVDAFRHRAAAIIADRTPVGYVYPWLTLTLRAGIRTGVPQNACRATNVIRHGLCPMLKCARELMNPAPASFATISASL